MSEGAIINSEGTVIAAVDVVQYKPGRFEGVVLSSAFPEALLGLLRKYERVASEQMLSLLDEIEQDINAYTLFYSEDKARLCMLQLWGENGILFWTETMSETSRRAPWKD